MMMPKNRLISGITLLPSGSNRSRIDVPRAIVHFLRQRERRGLFLPRDLAALLRLVCLHDALERKARADHVEQAPGLAEAQHVGRPLVLGALGHRVDEHGPGITRGAGIDPTRTRALTWVGVEP